MATRSNIVIGNFEGKHTRKNLEKKESIILFNMWDSYIENLGEDLKKFLNCGSTQLARYNKGNFATWLLMYLKTDYLKTLQQHYKEHELYENQIPNDMNDILGYNFNFRDSQIGECLIEGIEYLYVFDFDTRLLYMYSCSYWNNRLHKKLVCTYDIFQNVENERVQYVLNRYEEQEKAEV